MADEQVIAAPETPAPAVGGATAAAEPPRPDPAAGAPVEKVRDPNTVYKQEDVDKIVKAAKANERYRTKRELEAFYKGRESVAQPAAAEPAAPAPPAEEKPPVREGFNTYEEFIEAKAEYAGRKASSEFRAKEEAAAKEETARKTSEERANTFRTKLIEKYADIGARAQDIAHIVIPQHVVEAMHDSEHGPDILNGFIDNPKELERIMALSPSAALREMGKLEARYEAAVQKPEPSAAPALVAAPAPSRAPTPLRPVVGSAVLTDDEPSHNEPDKWRMWREKQLQKRKAGTQKSA